MVYKTKNKKDKENKENLNSIQEADDQTEMEVEGLVPPAPDINPNDVYVVNGENVAPFPQAAEVPLNENALQELIKKEEENLAKKENDKTKSLEEIQNDLNSLNSYFDDMNKNIYEDSFFADLKKRIV